VVEKVTLGQVSLRVIVVPYHYLSTAAPYSLLHRVEHGEGPVRGPVLQKHSVTPPQQQDCVGGKQKISVSSLAYRVHVCVNCMSEITHNSFNSLHLLLRKNSM
jgi:hypothetical protein